MESLPVQTYVSPTVFREAYSHANVHGIATIVTLDLRPDLIIVGFKVMSCLQHSKQTALQMKAGSNECCLK